MTAEIVASMRNLLDQLVNDVPGVTGALVATVDGFAIAEYLPPRTELDAPPPEPAALAAMTSALLGLSNRMSGTIGSDPVDEVVMSAPAGHVTMYRVANIAAMILLASKTADIGRVHHAGREAATAIAELIRSAAATGGAGPTG